MNTLLLLLLTASRFEANQGQGQSDGGVAWQVTCTNCSGGSGGSSYIGFDAGYVSVANFPATQAVSLASVPTHAVTLASTTLTGTSAVSGTLTCNAGSGTLAVSLASAPTTAVTNAGLTNLDVALSTRTKPADQQHAIIDSSATIATTVPLNPVVSAYVGFDGGLVGAQQVGTWTNTVTQATGTNLHAVLDATSTTACTQATGTNLHVVTDATSVLAANQSVNVAQMNGVATTMGNGVAGTGVQRVAISSDNTAFTVNARATGNTGAIFDAANNGTAPAQVLVIGAQLQSSATATAGTAGQVGNVVAGLDHVLFSRFGGPVSWSCFVEAVTATTQCQAAPGAGLKAYVTSVSCSNEAATVQGMDVIYGTGAACVTSPVALTHKFQMGTLATTTSPIVVGATFQSPLQPAAANAICVRPTASTAFGCTLTGYTAP